MITTQIGFESHGTVRFSAQAGGWREFFDAMTIDRIAMMRNRPTEKVLSNGRAADGTFVEWEEATDKFGVIYWSVSVGDNDPVRVELTPVENMAVAQRRAYCSITATLLPKDGQA